LLPPPFDNVLGPAVLNGAVAMGEAPVLLREDLKSIYLCCIRYLCESDPTASRASSMR
jgi:hypothetical protein